MEEKKTKKLNKKPLLICLAIALVFAIIGIVDINANAAENETYSLSVNRIDYRIGSDGKTCLDGYPIANNVISITSDAPIDVYYYQSVDTLSSDSYTEYTYVLSSGRMYLNGSPWECGTVNINGVNYYWSVATQMSATFANVQGYYELEFDGAEKIYELNTLSYQPNEYGRNKFLSDLRNGTLDCTQEIDYDTLPIDSSLPLIENVLANKISNKTGVNSGGHSVSAVKEFYDYITWKNTGNYDIQVERYPIVKLYEGTFSPKFLEDFEGDFYLMEILSAGNSSFTYQVDLPYIESNYPNDYSFLGKITTDVAGFWDTCELYYGYRLRYVDGANNKASCWTYVIPEQSNIKWDYIEYPYYSYVEYVDGSLSDNSDATGSSGEYDSLDDIEDALADVDKENQFKEEYEIVDGDVDVQEATNWLNTVVSFIKGTPQVVGSVLGFLPQPILYGMYVTVFLGVIASAIAIVKALF